MGTKETRASLWAAAVEIQQVALLQPWEEVLRLQWWTAQLKWKPLISVRI
jgi:hypothetical protein